MVREAHRKDFIGMEPEKQPRERDRGASDHVVMGRSVESERLGIVQIPFFMECMVPIPPLLDRFREVNNMWYGALQEVFFFSVNVIG